MLRTVAVVLLLSGVSFPQAAEAAPPSDAMPLSQILQTFEQKDGFLQFDEIEWEPEGYWEIEYFTTTGQLRSRVKVNVDPVTGEASPAKQWR